VYIIYDIMTSGPRVGSLLLSALLAISTHI
jgi:hypothetical protein